jgi:acyl-CoA:acyl-CoA alkyltransferase
MNGLDIADSFIKCEKYNNILICSGETPSKVIKYDVSNKDEFKNYFAGYTFGDAGSAVILSKTQENNGILFRYFYTDGNDWDIATIM